jgi:hypothetical protein
MILVSSRRRAAVKFPTACSLFVNQRALYSITGMTKYCIKSASATMLGMRRQANGFNRISILFYDNSGTAVCTSTVKIPDGWTPKILVGLLLQEWCLTKVISQNVQAIPRLAFPMIRNGKVDHNHCCQQRVPAPRNKAPHKSRRSKT